MNTLDRLVYLTEREGLKPTNITRELGISISSFTDWRKGKGHPSLEILMKFAERFNVSLDWLVYGEERGSKSSNYAKTISEIKLLKLYRELPTNMDDILFAYMNGLISASLGTSHSEGK